MDDLATIIQKSGLSKYGEMSDMLKTSLGWVTVTPICWYIMSLSLMVRARRKKQFAMIGPKTNTRFEVGINAKDFKINARLLEQPRGSMCNYVINVTEAQEVDTELLAWIQSAY